MFRNLTWFAPLGALIVLGCSSSDHASPKPQGTDPVEMVDDNQGSGGGNGATNSYGTGAQPSSGGSQATGGASYTGGRTGGGGGASTGGAYGTGGGGSSSGGAHSGGASSGGSGGNGECSNYPGTCNEPGNSDATIEFIPLSVPDDRCSSTVCTIVRSTKDLSSIAVDAAACDSEKAVVELFEVDCGKLGKQVNKEPVWTSGTDEACHACDINVPEGLLKFESLSKPEYAVCITHQGFQAPGDIRFIAKSGTTCTSDRTCSECKPCDEHECPKD